MTSCAGELAPFQWKTPYNRQGLELLRLNKPVTWRRTTAGRAIAMFGATSFFWTSVCKSITDIIIFIITFITITTGLHS
jgi:hypothetical protein